MSYREVILDQLVARNAREHVFHEMVVASKHKTLFSLSNDANRAYSIRHSSRPKVTPPTC